MEDQLRQNQSSWARLATPIIVEDLADDEALAFLTSPHFMEQGRVRLLFVNVSVHTGTLGERILIRFSEI